MNSHSLSRQMLCSPSAVARSHFGLALRLSPLASCCTFRCSGWPGIWASCSPACPWILPLLWGMALIVAGIGFTGYGFVAEDRRRSATRIEEAMAPPEDAPLTPAALGLDGRALGGAHYRHCKTGEPRLRDAGHARGIRTRFCNRCPFAVFGALRHRGWVFCLPGRTRRRAYGRTRRDPCFHP